MAFVFGVANKKGGVGKSSIISLFAGTSSNQPINKKVLVIDATYNKLLTFITTYQNTSLFKVVKTDLESVPKILAGVSNEYDIVFIDFPNNTNAIGYKTAAICCSHFIIPSGVGIMDQIATKDFLSLITEIASLRKAAGYSTDYRVMATQNFNEVYSNDFYALLDDQGVPHFEGALGYNDEIANAIDSGTPLMDYVTEGIGWTIGQEIFHKVFIEYHSLTE